MSASTAYNLIVNNNKVNIWTWKCEDKRSIVTSLEDQRQNSAHHVRDVNINKWTQYLIFVYNLW